MTQKEKRGWLQLRNIFLCLETLAEFLAPQADSLVRRMKEKGSKPATQRARGIGSFPDSDTSRKKKNTNPPKEESFWRKKGFGSKRDKARMRRSHELWRKCSHDIDLRRCVRRMRHIVTSSHHIVKSSHQNIITSTQCQIFTLLHLHSVTSSHCHLT